MEKMFGKIKTPFMLFVLMLMIVFICRHYRECDDYEEKIKALSVRLSEAEEHPQLVYLHDSVPVYKDRVVELDRTDYKKQLSDKQLIKDLQLKVADLESVNNQLLLTKGNVVLGSIAADTAGTLTYRDKWAFFSYDRERDELAYAVRDSLSTFVSCEYKHRFLWFRWKKKGYIVTIVSHNPHSSIEYEKYIKIK